MAISDNKITNAEIAEVHVQAAPDTLTGSAQQNKAVFDAYSDLIKEKHNSLIDDIDGEYASNWRNGSQTGSVRTTGSEEEGDYYTIGQYATAEGRQTKASESNSHAEGFRTQARGDTSHAEGYFATADGNNSHAEGRETIASGKNSHAEGLFANASGDNSHAEGNSAEASGNNSHAEGYGTIASSSDQHVSGRYNIEDTNNIYAEIIGNGTSLGRGNGRTLDWNGNEVLAGKLTVGTEPENNKDVATKGYVDTGLAGKVDKVTGKGLSTEDYTTSEKAKLSNIEAGAEVNVQADWNQSDSGADDYIKHKPPVPSVDSTLSTSGAAADAKKAGDEITGLKSAFNHTALRVLGNDEYHIGAFYTNTGVYTFGNIRGITDFINIENFVYAELTSASYVLSVVAFNGDTYLGTKSGLTTYKKSDITAQYSTADKIVLQFARTDSAKMTESDKGNITAVVMPPTGELSTSLTAFQKREVIDAVINPRYFEAGYNASIDSAAFTYYGNYYTSGSGTMTSSASYKSYYLTLTEDADFWVETTSPTTYYSVAVYTTDRQVTSSSVSTTFLYRYRSSDSNLPTKLNPLTVKANNTIIISVNSDASNFAIQTNYFPLVGGKLNNLVIFDSVNDNYIERVGNTITVKNGNAKYTIGRIDNDSINAHLWRITSCVIENDNGSAALWQNSDADGVIKINGEDDFVGGYHGDEVSTSFKVIIDGVENTNTTISKTRYKNLEIFTASNVYHCNTSDDANVIAFERNKIIKFDEYGCHILNHWTANGALSLAHVYMGMLSVDKLLNDNVTPLLNGYYTDIDFEVLGSSTSTAFNTSGTYVEMNTIYGTASMQMECITNKTNYGLFVTDYSNRLKAYAGQEAITVANGEVIMAKTTFRI